MTPILMLFASLVTAAACVGYLRSGAAAVKEAKRLNADSMERLTMAQSIHKDANRMLDEARASNADALRMLGAAQRLVATSPEDRHAPR